MFTGIVEEIGRVKAIKSGANSSLIEISMDKIKDDIKPGDSIAVNGLCLTATELSGDSFKADISGESLKRSNLGNLKINDRVNLERAMALGGRFGGHIVSGHVDQVGKIVSIKKDDLAYWLKIQVDRKNMKYIAEKGSITIDGISLTIANFERDTFSISLIPHSMESTSLKYRKAGDQVNVEFDEIAKYLERLINFEEKKPSISREFLIENGF